MCARHCLLVWGDFACFTRPEMKVERFSYPIMTPSAARGILEAIFLKPEQFRWQVVRIDMLAPPSYIALRRNEVKNKASASLVSSAMSSKARHLEPILADEDGEATGRTQRQTMALKNVRYRIWADILPWPEYGGHLEALNAQFERRARSGKCFFQPYLGCREFPAYFEYIEDHDNVPEAIPLDMDLGWMLYDVFDLSRKGNPRSQPLVSVFHAKLSRGIMWVPPYESDDVKRGASHAEPAR